MNVCMYMFGVFRKHFSATMRFKLSNQHYIRFYSALIKNQKQLFENEKAKRVKSAKMRNYDKHF